MINENLKKEVENLYSILSNESNDMNEIIQKYSITDEEMEQLKEQIEWSNYLYRITSHDYNHGDVYYDDSKEEAQKEEVEQSVRANLKHYIIRKKINDIKPEEITPDLMEDLIECGYDGQSSGNSILKSYFKMYVNTKKMEENDKNDKKRIASLEEKMAEMEEIVNDLTSKDAELQYNIQSRNQYIEKIRQRMINTKQKYAKLQQKLKPKSLGEKVKKFFSNTKIKKYIQEHETQIEEQCDAAMDDCDQAKQYKILEKNQNKQKIQQGSITGIFNNIYDAIISPISSNQKLVNLLNIYAVLKDKNYLDGIYKYIVTNSWKFDRKNNYDSEYDEKFFSHIVGPAAKDLEEKIKSGKYDRFDNSFKHLYSIKQMKDMFEEKNAEEIIAKGRNIENINKNVFDKLNSIFWNNGDKDRRQMYIDYIAKNNINLNREELLDWMDYRAVMEEFQNPKLMGFHMRRSSKR